MIGALQEDCPPSKDFDPTLETLPQAVMASAEWGRLLVVHGDT